MDHARRGWLFVAAQAALLVTLVVLPGRDDWPVPAWLSALGGALVVCGLALVVAAGLRLGPALTPSPEPTAAGQLRTDGLYRWVRHPIYSGVLAVVVGIVVGSGSVITAVVGGATFGFFWWKSSWEEARLRSRYPHYDAYARVTPRFVPRLASDRLTQ